MKMLPIGLSFAIFLSAVSAFGITMGQIDTFQSGSDNWQSGTGGLALVASGRPTGAADQYLQISSGANPLPPRLVALNDAQWLGDFTAAGVTSIAVDLLNPGSASLSIRIAIRESAGGATTPGYASTIPFMLPADGLWHLAIFDLNAASLTGFNSPQSLSADLANVEDFRIVDSAAPSGIGDIVTAQFGVDNITAVPEPSAWVLLVIGVLIASMRKGVAARCLSSFSARR
jgi:hypothetical protein